MLQWLDRRPICRFQEQRMVILTADAIAGYVLPEYFQRIGVRYRVLRMWAIDKQAHLYERRRRVLVG